MDTKIKALILLLFSAFTTFAQTPGINFAAKFNITSATGGDPYNITGIVLDDLSRFTGSDVQVNDSIYVIDGDQLYVLAVTSITSVVGPTVTLVANDPNNAGVSIPTGQAAICRPTDNYKLPLYISGLRDDLRSMVMNRQAQLIDDINGSAVSAITDFTSAGVNVPPSPAASLNGGETWRNMTTGELWGSDGNVWYPYTRGPKECQDTVLVSAITVQSGGSVTTGSPLIRNSSGVWEHMYNHPSGLNLIPDGVVTDIIVGGKAIIQYCGVRKGSGATPNTSYYVNQSISTGFTTTKPITDIRPLGKVASNGDFLVNAGLLFSRDNASTDTFSIIDQDKIVPNYSWKLASDIGNKQPKKIYLLGDSYFDNANYIQQYLYQRFNSDDYVGGGVFTTQASGSPYNTNVKFPVYTGTWTETSFSSSYPQTYTGLNGYTATSSNVGAKVVFETQATSYTDAEKFTGVKIFALNNSAVYRIRVDGGSWTTVTTISGNTVNTYSISGLSLAAHTVEVELLSGTLTLFGGIFSTNKTGATTIYKEGNSGSRTREWKDLVRSANWKSMISQVDPDVVFIHLGLNDNAAGVSPAAYKSNMDTIVTALKTQFADSVDIVLIAPVAPTPSYTTIAPVNFRNAVLKLSVEKNTGFISFYDAWKGSYNWAVQNDLFTQPDGIHPAIKGGTYLANEMYTYLKRGYNYVNATGLAGSIQFSDGKLMNGRDSIRVTAVPAGIQIGTGTNASQGYRLTLRGDAGGIGNLKVLNNSGQETFFMGSDAQPILKSYSSPAQFYLISEIPANPGTLSFGPRTTAVSGGGDFQITNNGRLFMSAYQLLLTGGGGIDVTGTGLFSGVTTSAGFKNSANNYYFAPSNTVEKWLSNDQPSGMKSGIVFKPTGAWTKQDIGLVANNISDVSAATSSDAILWARASGFVQIVNRLSIGSSVYPGLALQVNSNLANTSALQRWQTTTDSVKMFVTSASPNSLLTGRIGDLALGTNGGFYFKKTGANTNTGWVDFAALVTESTTIGAFQSSGNSNGLTLSGTDIKLHAATISTPGGVNVGLQTFGVGADTKIFNGTGSGQITVDGNTDNTVAGINFTQQGTDLMGIVHMNSSDADNAQLRLALEQDGGLVDQMTIGTLNDSKGMYSRNGLYEDVTTVTTSPYTVLYGDRNIYLDGTTITVNLQAIGTSTAETKIGRVIYFFNDNATNVTITPNGSETINDSASLTLLPNTGVTLLAVTGTKWVTRD